MLTPAQRIERVRQFRVYKPKDLSIAGAIAAIADESTRTHKKLGELIMLWEELVPAKLTAHTALSSFRNGVLHVVVASSSAMFELDRLLRAGLTDQLRQRFRGSLVRVKPRVGKLP